MAKSTKEKKNTKAPTPKKEKVLKSSIIKMILIMVAIIVLVVFALAFLNNM